MRHGMRSLTDSELIALLLSSGYRGKNAQEMAVDLMNHYESNLYRLFKTESRELQKLQGIGPAKASILLAAFELGRRQSAYIKDPALQLKNSQMAYDFGKQNLSNLNHEEFLILLLNNHNEVILSHRLSKGGLTGTIADGRILFALALSHQATGIILMHNHPSGQRKPSEADIQLTQNFKKFGKFIELPILDHIIFTDFGYFSFADEGLLDE